MTRAIGHFPRGQFKQQAGLRTRKPTKSPKRAAFPNHRHDAETPHL
jgi:hypothetical protein